MQESSKHLTSPQTEIADLHQRIHALEAKLAASQQREQLLQQLLDNLPAVVYGSDVQGRILFVNEPFTALMGFSPDQIIGKMQTELFPMEQVQSWQDAIQTVLTTHQPDYREETMPHPDGARIYNTARFPLTDAQDNIYGVGGISMEITARRHAEEALRESQSLLQGIVENSPMVIFVKDPDRRLLLVNERYATTINRPITDIIGKTEYDLFPAELVAAWRENDSPIFETGEPIQFENEFIVDNEPRFFITTQFPIYDQQGQPRAVCGIATDVTALKQIEQERQAMQNAIISAQKQALKELSTPLVPLADGVVAMPLIGSMDSTRAQQVIETLLEGVAKQSAHTAIVDITGLPMVDTHIANALLQAARAVKLLGAEVVLTGIQPEVAQTLVSLGADLSSVVTRNTLQSGVAYALNKH